MSKAGDEGLNADLASFDCEWIGFLGEGVFSTVNAPVHEQVVKDTFFAAIANPGVWTATWTDDGRAVVWASEFAAFWVTAQPLKRVKLN